MKKRVKIVKKGDRYTRLVVVEEKDPKKGKRVILCECDCGNGKEIFLNDLTTGRTQSCGCLGRERRLKAHTKHGEATRKKTTPEYSALANAKERCNNPNIPCYKHYGGRGIKFLIPSVTNLIEAIGRKPTPQHSLDRIDNNGNYEIGNIRWATKKEQRRNTRSNRIIKYKGRKKCLIDWAKELGINYSTLKNRLYRKKFISIESIFETPITKDPDSRTPRYRKKIRQYQLI